MIRRPRRNHSADFKAKVALATVRGAAPAPIAGSQSSSPRLAPLSHDVRDAVLLLQVLAGPSPDAESGTIPEQAPDFVAATERDVRGRGGIGVDPAVAGIAEDAAAIFETLSAMVDEAASGLALRKKCSRPSRRSTTHAFTPPTGA